jgi:hypothetical protein
MEKRARGIGASLRIESAEGTTVQVSLPLAPHRSASTGAGAEAAGGVSAL